MNRELTLGRKNYMSLEAVSGFHAGDVGCMEPAALALAKTVGGMAQTIYSRVESVRSQFTLTTAARLPRLLAALSGETPLRAHIEPPKGRAMTRNNLDAGTEFRLGD
jgi:hypothetical protein